MTDQPTTAQPSYPPRPHRGSREVLVAAFSNVLRDLFEMGYLSEEEVAHPDDALRDMVRAHQEDAFEFGQGLEAAGWSVDFQLVEFLDTIDTYDACKAAVAKWVKAHDVKVAWMQGQEAAHRTYEGSSTVWLKGTIVDVRHETAEVVFRSDQDERFNRQRARDLNEAVIKGKPRPTGVMQKIGTILPAEAASLITLTEFARRVAAGEIKQKDLI